MIRNETGFLCEARNVQSLAQQMERFINLLYDHKRQMGLASHDFVAEHFDKRKVVQETVEVLYGTKVEKPVGNSKASG